MAEVLRDFASAGLVNVIGRLLRNGPDARRRVRRSGARPWRRG